MRYFLNVILAITALTLVGCQTFTNVSTPLTHPKTQASDQLITETINTVFVSNGDFSDTTISVVTEAGVVTLTGYVKTIRQYDNAVKVASETPGVKGVRNHLVIRK